MDQSTGRCPWCGDDPLYVHYHDTDWGVPEYDSRALWEKLILDGFQAGLSWITILRKRESFRAAFHGFEPAVIAGWGDVEVTRLLADPGIVRHRGKITSICGSKRLSRLLITSGGLLAACRSRTGWAAWPRCRRRRIFQPRCQSS
jgi:DNA-3-methyladenine glycosylase I